MKSDHGNIITIILLFLIIFVVAGMYIVGTDLYNDLVANGNIIKIENAFYEGILTDEDKKSNEEEQLTVPEILQIPLNTQQDSDEKNEMQEQIVGTFSNIKENMLYNQLNEYSKKIYNGLQNSKEKMKNGTYQVDFGEAFSDILQNSNGQEQLKNYYQSAIMAFLYENPDVFYLEPRKMYLNISSTTYKGKTTYDVYINSGNEANYYIDGILSQQQLSEYIQTIESVKDYIVNNTTGTEYQKILKVHNYLVDTINYEDTISKNNIHNIYGALVNRECVCEGYAKAFMYLLNSMGIDCVVVIGTGTNSENVTESHSWNYVKVDGIWYAVDVTWDDPIIINGGKLSDKNRYRYFLKGSTNFNQNHIESHYFAENDQEFGYPVISEADY